MWTKDRLSDPSYVSPDSDSESAVRFAGVRGAASVPITIRGQPYGVLNILFFETHEFTDGEIQLLQTLADSAAVAINNARFIEETEQAREKATQLYEITEQLASTTDMDGILDLISEKAKELLRSDICAITRYDEAKGGLVLPPTTAEVNSALGEDLVNPLGAGTAGRAYAERRPVWSQDYLEDETLLADTVWRETVVEKLGIRAGLSVPIITRDEAYGALTVNFYEPHAFTDGEIQLLQSLADSAAVAIGNVGFIEEIQHRTAELDATN